MASHEVVISGMSGTFPECLNVDELEQTLFTNESLVTDDAKKWTRIINVPNQLGKMKGSFHFDQTFFGIHRRLCDVMDTHAKHSIEKSFEAICDAGLNPHHLSGTNIAVIMSSMTSETEYGSVMVSKYSGHAMLGHSRCMQANRISYFFNFKGPSFALDSSWVGPVQGLAIAKNLIEKGVVKAALVGGTSMIFNPEVSIHYDGLRKLNSDGKTKSYSADADGYSRAEGIGVFFLQRGSDAFRSYGSIVKVMCATEMDQRSVFSDQVGFNNFLRDFYSDLPISLHNSEIGYIEGDGAASLSLDAMELNDMAEVLCPGRDKPLLVSTCKSRMGHAESAAAFMSLATSLIAMKTGFIPSCLHFSSNNPLVPALEDGRIKIVTEKTPLEGEYVGITTIGLSSIYAHALLKRNPRTRGVRESTYFPKDDIPRIFLLSGREETCMINILNKVEKEPVDEYFYSMNQKLFKSEFPKHLYRGFAIVGENKSHSEVESYQSGSVKKPIWFIFSGMGSQWLEMGTGIMKIPVIRRAIQKCHDTLLPKGIDLISLITTTEETVFDNILHAFVGIAAIQIALVDLLEDIGITPDGIVGHSVGELGCSYADKCLTAEQVILAAYARGKASNDATLIKGMMAAVGKSYQDIKDELPDGIEVACHNSARSCTLSGPVEIMEVYVQQLKNRGIFAKLVNVANIAYHSKNIAPAAPYLQKYLSEIIPEPKLRSSKWVSSSVPEENWDSDLAKYCSAEYHTNNLLSYVLFEEATAHVPNNAICIEIAPHGLLQAITKKSLRTCVHVPLTNRTKKEGCSFLIEAIGKLYVNGVDMDLTKLYPEVELPVPRETEFLSTVVTWDHSEIWIPLTLRTEMSTRNPNVSWQDVGLFTNAVDDLLTSSTHTVFDQIMFPKSHLLMFTIDFLSEKLKDKSSLKGFNFQNLKFNIDLPYKKRVDSKVQLLLQMGTGNFELLHCNESVISGLINPMTSALPATDLPSLFQKCTGPKLIINESQIYDFFQGFNCVYKGVYRNISSVTITERGFLGKIKWNGDPVFFIEALVKLISFYSSIQNDALMDLDFISNFLFEPSSLPENNRDIDIYYDKMLGRIEGEGVRISFVRTKPVINTCSATLNVKSRNFLPYSSVDSNVEFMELCLQLIRENTDIEKLDLQVLVNDRSHICNMLVSSLLKQPLQAMMVNVRIRSSKDIRFIPEVASPKEFNGCYFIIAENELPETVNTLVDSDIKLYVVYTGKPQNKESFKSLTPLFEQNYHGHKVILFKKKNDAVAPAHYITLSTNYANELKSIEDTKTNKTIFLLFKYKMLSEILNILHSSSLDINAKKRCIFVDEFAPSFDPNHTFYKEQLKRDLKINIAFKGKWGSLRDKAISVSSVSTENLKYSELPFNDVRCSKVNLKVIGLNLQNIAAPTINNKFGVIEYSGLLGQDEVFGLGKLTEDNFLEVDPALCWKKPADWTMEEAATIPLFYCTAYNLLYMKAKVTGRPYHTVLIHGGHTTFSQAVINVAISMNIKVYTTCYNEIQKQFIISRFPQIDEENIYNIGDSNYYKLIDHIIESTEGDGVKVVIDALEDSKLRNLTIQCTGNTGRYFLVCNDDMDTRWTFGMSIFMKEICTIGFNPELLFDLSEDDKLILGGLLVSGIKTQIVKPLDNYIIREPCARKNAAKSIVEMSHDDRPRKVLMAIEEYAQSPEIIPKAVIGKKNYMIIGTYNNLWFDLLKWLVSRGATSIHVVLNQNKIPEFVRKRYNNYILKHRHIRITFNGTENLNTVQNCNEFIKKFLNGNTIDTVYYIKPGFEKQIANIDYALRAHSKSSNLVSIGFQACLITERRKNDDFKGTAFVLMKTNLRNDMMVSVLDDWLTKREEQPGFIIVDKEKQIDEVLNTDSEILPANVGELLDICNELPEQPCFTEMPTRSTPTQFNREIDPVFIFPGFKISKVHNFTRKLQYPAYMARYPLVINSISELASHLTKAMVQKFNLNMFTLIAEGWAGPLVLTIAKSLEQVGKMSEIILLDVAPSTIKKWTSHMTKSRSIISKYMPSLKDNEEISLKDLKSYCNQLSICISKEENVEYTSDEIHHGLETMINRLEVVSDFPPDNFKVKSVIHIFTPDSTHHDLRNLNQICEIPCKHHILPGISSEAFLDCPSLVENTCNLALLEYKRAAKVQVIRDIATLDFILDAKFNTEGLIRESSE